MKTLLFLFTLLSSTSLYAAVDCPFVQGDGACHAADRAEGRCVDVDRILAGAEDVRAEEADSIE